MLGGVRLREFALANAYESAHRRLSWQVSAPPAGFSGLHLVSGRRCAKDGETLLGVFVQQFSVRLQRGMRQMANIHSLSDATRRSPKSLSMVNLKLAPAGFGSSSLSHLLARVFLRCEKISKDKFCDAFKLASQTRVRKLVLVTHVLSSWTTVRVYGSEFECHCHVDLKL